MERRRLRGARNREGVAFGDADLSPAGAPLILTFRQSQVVDAERVFGVVVFKVPTFHLVVSGP